MEVSDTVKKIVGEALVKPKNITDFGPHKEPRYVVWVAGADGNDQVLASSDELGPLVAKFGNLPVVPVHARK